jgi:hypothetical protein
LECDINLKLKEPTQKELGKGKRKKEWNPDVEFIKIPITALVRRRKKVGAEQESRQTVDRSHKKNVDGQLWKKAKTIKKRKIVFASVATSDEHQAKRIPEHPARPPFSCRKRKIETPVPDDEFQTARRASDQQRRRVHHEHAAFVLGPRTRRTRQLHGRRRRSGVRCLAILALGGSQPLSLERFTEPSGGAHGAKIGVLVCGHVRQRRHDQRRAWGRYDLATGEH